MRTEAMDALVQKLSSLDCVALGQSLGHHLSGAELRFVLSGMLKGLEERPSKRLNDRVALTVFCRDIVQALLAPGLEQVQGNKPPPEPTA